MYEDDPQDIVFDVLGEAVFGEHPLGRPIIGRAPVIRDTPVEEIAAFHARRYVPGVDRDRGRRLGRPRPDRRARRRATLGAPRRSSPAPPLLPAPRRPALDAAASSARTPSRSTSASAPSGCRATTTAASPLRVLDAIFGGLSSSRLFQAVREERGLAYSVYSFTAQFTDTGEIGLYVGTRPDNLRRGDGDRRAPSSTACAASRRDRGGARAGARERQGADRARARVGRRAHEPAGRLGALRAAAARDRRDHGAASTP